MESQLTDAAIVESGNENKTPTTSAKLL